MLFPILLAVTNNSMKVSKLWLLRFERDKQEGMPMDTSTIDHPVNSSFSRFNHADEYADPNYYKVSAINS